MGWLIVVAALLMLVLIAWAQRRMPLLQYLYFWRFSLLTALALIGVVPLSLNVATSLLRNLFSLGPWGILFISWLGTLTAWVVMITMEIVCRYAPLRFGVDPFPVPRWISRYRVGLFSLLAWPLIGATIVVSPPAREMNLLAAVGGILLAALSLLAAVALRAMLRDPSQPAARILLPVTPKWVEALPKLRPQPRTTRPALSESSAKRGYVEPEAGRVSPGHLLAATFFLITLVIYALGFYFLRPGHGSMPALGFVLLILILTGWALPGVSFFLDAFRVPVLLPLIVASFLLSQVFDTDHYYCLIRPDKASQEAVSPAEPPAYRIFQAAESTYPELEHPVVVVATTGGGITAALWTAQVLTSLQREIGQDFSRSIRLISSVSGGSVGTLYFLDRFSPAGPPAPNVLERIVDAAGQPSLDNVAWGLAYPDLLRTFLWLPDKTLDRGWAMEQAWRSHMTQPNLRLSQWREGMRKGWLPATVLNSTASETGQQFLLTPLAKDPKWPALFFSSVYPGRDILVSTAARLSATFPWVGPITRAQDCKGQPIAPGYHLADGGYYDNYGVVSVVNWLRSLDEGQLAMLRQRRLLLVLIRAFPDGAKTPPPSKQRNGWLFSTVGPLLTMYRVRTSSQVASGSAGMELVQEVLKLNGIKSQQVIFTLGKSSPLSWKLTSEERQVILDDWKSTQNQNELNTARTFFESDRRP
jgi:hypothetical protein